MPQKTKSLTYEKTGVSYEKMDPVKRFAQKQALLTKNNLKNLNEKEVEASRGESAYVYDCGDHMRALVIEGLGTKNLVADEMEKITGKNYYEAIAQDTVASIVNDLISVGAKPEVISAYFAVGDSNWFNNETRIKNLTSGWKKACDIAGVTWGGGETPTLSGIINPKTIELGGTATGVIRPKARLTLGEKLGVGDLVVLIESSGIHANGLTMVREIAQKLPKGFLTKMSNGEIFGEAILRPTIIYTKFIDELFISGVDIHYMSNITGHGWRKIMRHTKKLRYVLENIPQPQEEFRFMQKNGPISDEEAYGNFNMGVGFAIFISPKDFLKLEKVAFKNGLKVYKSGYIESGPKEVVIKPKNIVFKSETLDLR